LFACGLLVPLATLLPVSRLERLLLVLSMLLVVLAELFNSAIEAAIDRISFDRHPLSGRAKDLGSAAVAVALLMSALCWLVIAGPVLLQWWSR
jgi:diacylglycerol kinase (ATP)